ncbi:MAG: type II CRISPR RNA-guided endonuclease Cas9, partial [Candidatus Methylomirabilis sp.]|nr:type II CRISPR RNA-guided endonuclease Cas9 [Deltaproteobacteria bacterium]
MGPQGDAPFILGLDIGANSVGWALLRAEPDPEDAAGKRLKPVELVRSGVRIFEAGTEGDIESGKDESRAVKRREARLRRRLLARRRMRLEHLFHLLQRAGLLPTEPPATPEETSIETRARILSALDRSLAERYGKSAELAHVLPYWLRAQALDRALEPYELGRALYHLAQRRGFLSNRKSLPKKDEKPGEVAKEIGELRAKMEAAGARTLGEYFAGLDPTEERIRSRWTAREMYLSEFEAIWKSQERFRPALLTDDLRKKIHRAIFRQRPLKSAKGLIGGCQFEPGEKRAPLALLACQRFRILQKVNDLTIRPKFEPERALTAEQRSLLLDALETQGDLTFKQIRKLLGLPRDMGFSHEAGGEEKLPGDRTASKLGEKFGPGWAEMSAEERDRVVEDVRSIQKDETLEKRGRRAWGLEGKAAEQFGKLGLEEDYLGLSLKAVNKLLPHLERGVRYATAVREVYGDRPPPPVAESLPRVDEALPQLRNPAVHRALTELRKVVNAVVREHGKPAVVRIELARDLKKNRKDRMRIAKRNRDNQKLRDAAADFIRPGSSTFDHKRADVEKVHLAEECGWICPYTD